MSSDAVLSPELNTPLHPELGAKDNLILLPVRHHWSPSIQLAAMVGRALIQSTPARLAMSPVPREPS
jgi:hypothetical protein